MPSPRHVLASALISLTLVAASSSGASHRSSRAQAAPRRPSLIVVIAVDQLGEDLLERYDSLFTGGFRRLRDRGMSYSQAWVDHAITVSHPGHVTLATGTWPSRHGIVDAAFYEGPP